MEKGFLDKLVELIDSRVGFSKNILKPEPKYSLHPINRLGALITMAFLLQGFTGMLMLPHYVPLPDRAYESTINIASSVPFGSLIQSMHLYTAYVIIFLAFIHLARVYFFAAYKKPRELMWFIGMLMGFIILSSAFTGFLLPWTVISKLTTNTIIDLINMIRIIPGVSFLTDFIIGVNSDEELLLRFFAFHIIIFPTALIILLVMKIYLLEVHGISKPLKNASEKFVAWFPNVFIYLLMLSSSFLAMILIISILFPIAFPPKFSPDVATQYKQMPEWYFLWLYQIFKIEVFEGGGSYTAIVLLSVFFTLLFFLPFIDLGSLRHPLDRPVWTTIGVVTIVEIIILTVLGYMNPNITISNIEAIIFLGGSALLTITISYFVFKKFRYEKEVFSSTYIINSQFDLNKERKSLPI